TLPGTQRAHGHPLAAPPVPLPVRATTPTAIVSSAVAISSVGKGGFEPPASTSRTWRANQAALLPVAAIIAAARHPATSGPGNATGPTTSATAHVLLDQL